MSKVKQRYCQCGNPVYNRKRKCDECKERDAQPKGHKCRDCDNIIFGKARVCPVCKERKRIEKRTRKCPKLGHEFVLEENQHGGESLSREFKEGLITGFLFRRLRDFIENPMEYFPGMSLEAAIDEYALRARNDVQSTSSFPEYKVDIEFENVSRHWDKKKTYDHNNSMKYTLKHYIKMCLKDKSYLTPEYLLEYYRKYANQFPVLQKHNQDLIDMQQGGSTSDKYLDIVGNVIIDGVVQSREDSKKIISPYFIHG